MYSWYFKAFYKVSSENKGDDDKDKSMYKKLAVWQLRALLKAVVHFPVEKPCRVRRKTMQSPFALDRWQRKCVVDRDAKS